MLAEMPVEMHAEIVDDAAHPKVTTGHKNALTKIAFRAQIGISQPADPQI
mgnify:CR=1 FL=1